MPGEHLQVLGSEFVQRVISAFKAAFDIEEISSAYDRNSRPTDWVRQPDILASLKSGAVIIAEVRNYSPGTSYRIEEIASSLQQFVEDYRHLNPTVGEIRPTLVISGTLSPLQYRKLSSSNIKLIDGPALELLEQADRDSKPFPTLLNEISNTESDRVAKQMSGLTATVPGKAHWAQYQRLCGDILQLAFCPPLQTPIVELSNRTGVNRRDFILPNYAEEGFWRFARESYGAHHLVVDAKNYSVPLRKESVLQIANYLNDWGCGKFGILCTRVGASSSALEVVREQWVMYKKLILVLDDGDVTQLLELKRTGGRTDELVRQKIEDFRLSF